MAVIQPFDRSGIIRGADGIARYQDLHRSVVEMLRTTVDEFPEREFLVEAGGGRLTYRQVWDRAARVAGGLRAEGVARGDRVAIQLPNGIDWCLAFFGAQMAGAIAVPVNTRLLSSEARYVTDDSGSRFVFLQDEPLPDGPSTVVDTVERLDTAAIFYTSGTTGFPKGAMITHENFLANVENCTRAAVVPLPKGMRGLISVPLFHVTGCNAQLLMGAYHASTVVIMPTFEVRSFLAVIREESIDALVSVPAIYWLALHQPEFPDLDTSRVQRVSYGGAPIAPGLVLRIMEAFPNARIANGFGLTETSALATLLPHEFTRQRPESVGFPAPVVDVKLNHADGGGDAGELLIRGQNVVKGYWNKPEATAQTFVDGWLHTGDMARIDAEGFVQIVDRKKDMVNRGGENVYCVEVENALGGHPSVFEAAVMGVPDPMMGEKVGAVVVPKPGCEIDEGELLEFAAGRLADFKVPQYVVVRRELLPRNPGGKILKKHLRDSVCWVRAGRGAA